MWYGDEEDGKEKTERIGEGFMTLKEALVTVNTLKSLRSMNLDEKKAVKIVSDYAQTKYLLDSIDNEKIGQVSSPRRRGVDYTTPYEFYCWHECDICSTPVSDGDCFCRHCGTIITWVK